MWKYFNFSNETLTLPDRPRSQVSDFTLQPVLQHCSRCAVSCTHFTTALCPLSRCWSVTRRSEGWSSVATHAARGPGLKRSIVFSNSPSPHSTALCCTVLAVSCSTAAAHQIPCSAAVMVMTLCLLLSPAAGSRTAD